MTDDALVKGSLSPSTQELRFNSPRPELEKAWNEVDDDQIISITKADLTLLMNTMSSVIQAVSAGQMASFEADHHNTSSANSYIAVYRTFLQKALDSFGQFTNRVMSSRLGGKIDDTV